MKIILLFSTLLIITLSGCSTSQKEPFVNEQLFKEKNRPFLTVYQTEGAQTTMVELDKTNDQVIIKGEAEYVLWHLENISTSNTGTPKIAEITTEIKKQKSPFFIHKDSAGVLKKCDGVKDGCSKEHSPSKVDISTEIIYDIGECHFKGCD